MCVGGRGPDIFSLALVVIMRQPSDQRIEVEGEVVETLPNTLFRVKLPNTRIVLCHLSGKMRLNFIRLMPGDRVKIEMTPYDATKGRIVYRLR